MPTTTTNPRRRVAAASTGLEAPRDAGLAVVPNPGMRVLDVLLSACLLVLALPVLLVIGAITRLTSPGPAIYRQRRVGLGGRCFTIYKIRTMAHQCERETGPVWCLPGDARVTRLGRFLRATHLDELPQLWNILKGDMSLVGPRPERPEFADGFAVEIPRYRERLAVRPGLTGLAQVSRPPDLVDDDVRCKLAIDLCYIERRGLGLDLRILLCTGAFLLGVPFCSSRRVMRLPAFDANGVRLPAPNEWGELASRVGQA